MIIYHLFFFFISTVTNKKPFHLSITKVKQFQGLSSFVKRSQWTIDQLRQINGIDSIKVRSLNITNVMSQYEEI